MRILVITPTFFPIMGGAEIGIYEIFRRMTSKHKVMILTPKSNKVFLRNYEMEESVLDLSKIELLRFEDRINLIRWPGQWKLKGLIPPFSLSMVKSALKIIKKYQPDVVNVFYALPSGLAAVFVKRMKKTPVILSLIGRDIPGPNIPRFWGNYARMIAKTTSERIYISKYCRNALFGPYSEDGYIVPFGVDLERYKPDLDGSQIRKSYSIPSNAKVLFALQRLDVWKRVDVIIRAMKILLENMDAFLVIGGKGPMRDQLTGLVKELGISSRVIFTGYIEENKLPFYYAMADVFVFHSTYETFGLVLLQAMASGKPIVTVSSTAIPELIENNENGILVEPLNHKAFAQGLINLLKGEENMKRFSIASRRKALETYSWDRVADQYEEVFFRCQK